VSSLLEVLVLDVLQVSSLLGGSDVFGAGLDGFGLGLDVVHDILGSLSDLIHKRGLLGLLSDELVIRTGLKSLAAHSRIVHEDGLEVLKGILAGFAHNFEVESGIVCSGKTEAGATARDVESSHQGISPIVESEDKSVVVLEVEDAEGSHGSKDGLVASHLLDFGFFEEKDFDTLDHAVGFFAD